VADDDEEVRLLDACATSLNKSLLSIVTVALDTWITEGGTAGVDVGSGGLLQGRHTAGGDEVR
jgi:hypothetical protein